MKRAFCFLFFISAFSYGQVDSLKMKNNDSLSSENKTSLGVQAGTFISFYNWGANYSFGVSIERKRSFLTVSTIVGPKYIYMYENIGNTSKAPRSLNGLSAIYQFTPRYKKKVFNMFFQYQFIYRNYREQESFEYSFSVVPLIEPYKAYYSLLENDLSLGFKIKFLKRFYYTTSIGAGYAIENVIVDFKHFEDTNRKEEGVSFIANACIGYKFNKN